VVFHEIARKRNSYAHQDHHGRVAKSEEEPHRGWTPLARGQSPRDIVYGSNVVSIYGMSQPERVCQEPGRRELRHKKQERPHAGSESQDKANDCNGLAIQARFVLSSTVGIPEAPGSVSQDRLSLPSNRH